MDKKIEINVSHELLLALEQIAEKYKLSLEDLIKECITESLSDDIYDATHP